MLTLPHRRSRLLGRPRATAERLAGRVVLVTGATSGVGRATCERLLDRGALVVGCARTEHRVRQVRSRVPALDLRAVDLTDAAARERLIADVTSAYGQIDVLVNSAGIGRYGPFAEHTQQDVTEVYATNTVALADLTRLALPQMVARGDGDVVMVSSSAAWTALPGMTLYSSSKSAVEGLVQGLRRELRGSGVRVHSLQPGPLATELLSRTAGYEPHEGEDLPRRLPPLPGPDRAARQVERVLSSGRARTVAVPRAVGLARPVAARPVGLLLDALGPAPFRLRRLSARLKDAQRPSGSSR